MTIQPETTEHEPTSDNPYPTIADKVALFKENGIAVFDYLNPGEGDNWPSIYFDGDIADAERAVAVARDIGVGFLSLSLVRDFYSGGNTSHPYWLMTFPHQMPNQARPTSSLTDCQTTAAYLAHDRHWG